MRSIGKKGPMGGWGISRIFQTWERLSMKGFPCDLQTGEAEEWRHLDLEALGTMAARDICYWESL